MASAAVCTGDKQTAMVVAVVTRKSSDNELFSHSNDRERCLGIQTPPRVAASSSCRIYLIVAPLPSVLNSVTSTFSGKWHRIRAFLFFERSLLVMVGPNNRPLGDGRSCATKDGCDPTNATKGDDVDVKDVEEEPEEVEEHHSDEA